MPGARDDYLLRMIQQVAAILRHLISRVKEGAPSDEIVRDAGAAIGELLGPQRTMLEMLDARSAAALVGDPEKLELWIALLRMQAEASGTGGDTAKAAKLLARAETLNATRLG